MKPLVVLFRRDLAGVEEMLHYWADRVPCAKMSFHAQCIDTPLVTYKYFSANVDPDKLRGLEISAVFYEENGGYADELRRVVASRIRGKK